MHKYLTRTLKINTPLIFHYVTNIKDIKNAMSIFYISKRSGSIYEGCIWKRSNNISRNLYMVLYL